MKKIIALGVVFVGMLALGAVVFLMPKPTTQIIQSVPAGSGVFKIKQAHNSNIRIVPGYTTRITLDLEGPQDELKKVRFFRIGGNTELNILDEWENVSGTITVPEGTIVDIDIPDEEGGKSDFIRLGGGSSVTINDMEVRVTGGGTTPPPPPPTQPDDVTGDDEPETTQYNPADDDDDAEDDEPQTTQYDPGADDDTGDDDTGDDEPETTQYEPEGPSDPNIRCSINLRQEDRNDCCQTAFADEPHPECAYTGYWLFNYHTRLCYYHCFHPCNVGTAEQRNTCCADEYYYDTTPPCIGNWTYESITSGCSYECLSEDELEEYFGDDDTERTDFVSQACSQHSNPDTCCDYNLKNEISIGPRPGFPDCIGKWDFDEATALCSFSCSDYGEMLEILEQLEERG